MLRKLQISMVLMAGMMLLCVTSLNAVTRYHPHPPKLFQHNPNNVGKAQPNHYQDSNGDVLVQCIGTSDVCFTIGGGGAWLDVNGVAGLPPGGTWQTIQNL